MERLERILHAEDAARARVSEAREQAAVLEREAVVRATTDRQTLLADAAAAADARTAELTGAAKAEAAAYTAEAAADLERLMDAASTRVETAVARVLGELVD